MGAVIDCVGGVKACSDGGEEGLGRRGDGREGEN